MSHHKVSAYGTYSMHTLDARHFRRGVSYKVTHDPYSKMLIESSNETKKLFHVSKDKIVLVLDSVAHFTGEEV